VRRFFATAASYPAARRRPGAPIFLFEGGDIMLGLKGSL